VPPLPALLYAVRIWAAIVLALYAAFWLQLGRPNSATSATATAPPTSVPRKR
jgi:uncharacterized membrane protein YccC